MVTELQYSIAIAIAFGFISGAFQSWLTDVLYSDSVRQTISPKNTTLKYFLNGLGSAILLSGLTFVMFSSQAIASYVKLNYFSITLAIALGFNPLLTKLLLSFVDKLKNSRSKET